MQQKTFGGRAPPGSARGAYSAPPDALTGFREKGREGKDRREGKGGEERAKGMGRKGKGCREKERKGKEKREREGIDRNEKFLF